MIVWDEKKRQSNLEKHGLDFLRAHLVFDNQNKVTFSSPYKNENRLLDVAMVEMAGRVLALVYVKRGNDMGDLISRRIAKRKESVCAATKI